MQHIKKFLILILLLNGCTTYSERTSEWYYNCAASLMEVEPLGPVPSVDYVADFWFSGGQLVRGTYQRETNHIRVKIELNEQENTLVHEMAHAVRHHLNDFPSEYEASIIGNRFQECY